MTQTHSTRDANGKPYRWAKLPFLIRQNVNKSLIIKRGFGVLPPRDGIKVTLDGVFAINCVNTRIGVI